MKCNLNSPHTSCPTRGCAALSRSRKAPGTKPDGVVTVKKVSTRLEGVSTGSDTRAAIVIENIDGGAQVNKEINVLFH